MNIKDSDLNQVKQLLKSAKEILVLTGKDTSIDSLAASLALYFVLPTVGKNVNVVCPNKINHKNGLIGVDKINNSLENNSLEKNRKFIVSLDYEEGSIEKVSYNITGDKFNLVIKPRPGFSFSKDKVSFSEGTGKADLIFTIALPDFSQLGDIASRVKEISDNLAVVNIDIHTENKRYGKVNLVYPGMGSVSEVVTNLLSALNLKINKETAINLLTGIKNATKNFTIPQTTPDSFEAAAQLSRIARSIKKTVSKSAEEQKEEIKTFSFKSPFPQNTTSKPISQPTVPTQQASTSLSETSSKDETTPPREWLRPKILTSKNNKTSSPDTAFE